MLKKYITVAGKGKTSEKLNTLSKYLQDRNGLIVVQVLADSDNYMSLCREHAIICTSLGYITNMWKGSPYGDMANKWSDIEILNFGYICLFFALRQCIIESPNEIHLKHIYI